MITNWQVGDKVRITKKTWRNIRDSNRSIKFYPSDSYVEIAKNLIGISGIVERKLSPGFEVNVEFENGQILQMNDNWIEKI